MTPHSIAHRLGRVRERERDEVVRGLAGPGTTGAQAAERLGMSRASVYRTLARYGIRMPGPCPSSG
ncbi:helix-turn-helix domain-containing protein [Streptomyces sp. 7R007]